MNSVGLTASNNILQMHRTLFVTVLIFLAAWSTAWADPAVESAQKKLKDEGFYYGEINGHKDADTTAAIRRYQIRNGMKITGELDTETQRALGLTSKAAATPAPRPQPATRPSQTPGPPPPNYPQENSAPKTTPVPRAPAPQRDDDEDDDEDEVAPPPPRPVVPNIQSVSPLGGTPYEGAPPRVQQEIISRAQVTLLRQGYYRDEVNGLYGPPLNFALRNYQKRFGLAPTGRLDVETLALLNLLPEQQASGGRRFHRRFFAPRSRFFRPDEPVYIPR
jgi:peptidoglycan hydrolase-like protein with peptidoglycan-binding domain